MTSHPASREIHRRAQRSPHTTSHRLRRDRTVMGTGPAPGCARAKASAHARVCSSVRAARPARWQANAPGSNHPAQRRAHPKRGVHNVPTDAAGRRDRLTTYVGQSPVRACQASAHSRICPTVNCGSLMLYRPRCSLKNRGIELPRGKPRTPNDIVPPPRARSRRALGDRPRFRLWPIAGACQTRRPRQPLILDQVGRFTALLAIDVQFGFQRGRTKNSLGKVTYFSHD